VIKQRGAQSRETRCSLLFTRERHVHGSAGIFGTPLVCADSDDKRCAMAGTTRMMQCREKSSAAWAGVGLAVCAAMRAPMLHPPFYRSPTTANSAIADGSPDMIQVTTVANLRRPMSGRPR